MKVKGFSGGRETEEEHEAHVRGRCPMCNRYVWSDHARFCDKGEYFHEKCPIRMGGLIEDCIRWDKYWMDREEKWNATIGKDAYVKKQLK